MKRTTQTHSQQILQKLQESNTNYLTAIENQRNELARLYRTYYDAEISGEKPKATVALNKFQLYRKTSGEQIRQDGLFLTIAFSTMQKLSQTNQLKQFSVDHFMRTVAYRLSKSNMPTEPMNPTEGLASPELPFEALRFFGSRDEARGLGGYSVLPEYPQSGTNNQGVTLIST